MPEPPRGCSLTTSKGHPGRELRSVKEREYSLGDLPTEAPTDGYAELGLTDPEDLTGADPFGKAFVDALLPRQAETIRLADEAARRSKDPAVRSLARDIAREREREISTLSAYREEWYPAAG
jgi:uncharacterized protein (DUF305 family)